MQTVIEIAYFVPLLVLLLVAAVFLLSKADTTAGKELRALQTVILAVIPLVNLITIVLIVAEVVKELRTKP